MQDFEKLGVFYLGKRFDDDAGTRTDELLLYDSKDLTTHAVIIGMTGSGKTGLGIDLIEECAIDHVPVIAVDPKGDLGNLLLTFPALDAGDFAPWVDPGAASAAGQTLEQHAAVIAARWRKGLGEWGQPPERIAKLRAAADFALYTPGGSAGRPLSVLRTLAAPEGPREPDALQERVEASVLGLLALLGIEADVLTSREYILLARVVADAWEAGEGLDLPQLIAAVQNPPLERIGVMPVDAFYPPQERFELATRINNLLASPGFAQWTKGEALSADRLLFDAAGRPRVCVLSIAHLSDAERMFFVTLLLGELITWMRRQPGSSSLRAVLYMDEIFGYLPPVAEPPSKRLFLTLLKQARAYGLGVVIATQNPVDLDYKALSNAGTWLVGRLQTERDVERVREGLRSTAHGERLDGRKLDATLAGLPKRCFLLHNVHDASSVVFETRWAMSYLAGPLTHTQIARLAGAGDETRDESAREAGASDHAAPSQADRPDAPAAGAPPLEATAPVLPPGIGQYFLAPSTAAAPGRAPVLAPHVLVAGNAHYRAARLEIDEHRDFALLLPLREGSSEPHWKGVVRLEADVADLDREPPAEARYAALPSGIASVKAIKRIEAAFKRWYRAERPLALRKSAVLGERSTVGESERAFRIRLQQIGNARRDRRAAALRERYEKRLARLEERLLRAEHAVARETDQARSNKLDTALTIGTAVLGALLGRKAVSTTTATRVGSALRKAGGLSRQRGDVARAEAVAADVRRKLQELEQAFADEVAAVDVYVAQDDELEVIPVRATLAGIDVRVAGLAWAAPHGGASGSAST